MSDNNDLVQPNTDDAIVENTDAQGSEDTGVNDEAKIAEEARVAEEARIADFNSDSGVIVISNKIDENAQWFVVHTYSGHENKVATQLKQRVESIGQTDKFFKVLIPHQQKIVVSEGKKRKVDERLFPGYILVQMIMNDDTWYLVRSTRGVTGFVGTGSNPTPLSEKEVQTLVKFMRTEEPKFEAKFSVGDAVKITEGPFAEFLGKVDDINEEQGKLKVLISVFGQETPVELDFMQVKSI
jgi:transcription termination/antitermination protein NusG